MNNVLRKKPRVKERIGIKRFAMKWGSAHGLVTIGWKIVRTVILVGCCFTILYPFLVKIINSFKSFEDYLDPSVQYIPKYFTFENIRAVMNQMVYWRSLRITVVYCAIIGILQVIVCSMAGYGLARFKFKGNGILFGLVVLQLLVPPQTMIISLFTKFRFFYGGLNLIGTYWPYIVMAATGTGIRNGLYIFMFRQVFRNMPKELEDAALVDGAGAFRTYVSVMMPNTVSTSVCVFLISVAWQWTDTTMTNLLQSGTELLSIVAFAVDGGEEEVMVSQYSQTAGVLTVLPIMVIYLVGQRFFIQGVENSGITG